MQGGDRLRHSHVTSAIGAEGHAGFGLEGLAAAYGIFLALKLGANLRKPGCRRVGELLD